METIAAHENGAKFGKIAIMSVSVAEQMAQKLRDAFQPSHLEIVDESHKHQGHSGWREGGESHFQVYMTSARFNDETRVSCQRMVYQTLQAELAGPVHALSLDLKPQKK